VPEEGTMNTYRSGRWSYESCILHTSLIFHFKISTLPKFKTFHHHLTPHQNSLTIRSDRVTGLWIIPTFRRFVCLRNVSIYSQGDVVYLHRRPEFWSWVKIDILHIIVAIYTKVSPQIRKYPTTLALHRLTIAPNKLGRIRRTKDCSARFRADAILARCLAGPPCHPIHVLHRLVFRDPATEIRLFTREGMCRVTI
jgi:hypothetical protein